MCGTVDTITMIKNMDLKLFDNMRVRITCKDGEVYEGICNYYHAEYCEIEFGRDEECLEIINFLFYKSDIKNIEIIEQYSEPYGKIEEYYALEGIDCLDDVWYSDENEHTLRMLRCLEDKLNDKDYPYRNEVYEALKKLTEYTDDEKIKAKAEKLLTEV